MGNVGPLELVVVLVIALVIFGPKRVPELGKSVGKGIREFQSALAGHTEDEEEPTATRVEAETLPSSNEAPPTASAGSAVDQVTDHDRT